MLKVPAFEIVGSLPESLGERSSERLKVGSGMWEVDS
jgi:hypothetical protein